MKTKPGDGNHELRSPSPIKGGLGSPMKSSGARSSPRNANGRRLYFDRSEDSSNSKHFTPRKLSKGYLKGLGLDKALFYLEAPSEVIPGLYIGSTLAGKNRKNLIDNQITHILTLRDPCDPPLATFPEFQYHAVDMTEDESEILSNSLEDCFGYISHVLEIAKGTIYIQCHDGASRSAIVALYFLIKNKGLNYDEAYAFLSGKRPVIHPSEHLVVQVKYMTSAFHEMVTSGSFKDLMNWWLTHCASTGTTQVSGIQYHMLKQELDHEKSLHIDTKDKLDKAQTNLRSLLEQISQYMKAAEEEREKLLETQTNIAKKEEEYSFTMAELNEDNQLLNKRIEELEDEIRRLKKEKIDDLQVLMEELNQYKIESNRDQIEKDYEAKIQALEAQSEDLWNQLDNKEIFIQALLAQIKNNARPTLGSRTSTPSLSHTLSASLLSQSLSSFQTPQREHRPSTPSQNYLDQTL